MTKKINLLFNHSFSSNIWKLYIDHKGDLLIAETRNTDTHATFYSVIHLSSGELIVKESSFEENWWIGISASYQHKILFHLLDEEHQLKPASFFLFDISSKKIVWTSSSFHFLKLCSEGILGNMSDEDNRDEDDRKYVLLDPVTGKEKVLDAKEANPFLEEDFENEGNKSSAYPFHYLEGSEYFNTVKAFLYQNFDITPVKGLDYLEFKDTIIISCYLYMTGNLEHQVDNFLLVLDKEGKRLLYEKIDTELNGIGIETFLVLNNQLIYSRNKKEIISYLII